MFSPKMIDDFVSKLRKDKSDRHFRSSTKLRFYLLRACSEFEFNKGWAQNVGMLEQK